ncbi:MAG: 50S ribosomal protein L24 [Actinomycetes bacterium]|jgi:large subunit ribosomal protein L24
MRIKKGDEVVVRVGKWAGHRGEVIRALPSVNKVEVAGANIAKRHVKQQGQTMQAGIIDKFVPMPVSSVSLWCKACDGPTRAGMKVEGDTKVRVCRKCGADL